jgi:hypothetical protein
LYYIRISYCFCSLFVQEIDNAKSHSYVIFYSYSNYYTICHKFVVTIYKKNSFITFWFHSIILYTCMQSMINRTHTHMYVHIEIHAPTAQQLCRDVGHCALFVRKVQRCTLFVRCGNQKVNANNEKKKQRQCCQTIRLAL